MFFRGVDGGKDAGVVHNTGLNLEEFQMQTGSSDQIVSTVKSHMDEDQTFRYAQASGDFMPIHIDDEFARSVGLGGIIIHGLCTMANASWAAIQSLCDSDPAKLKRMALRFSKPLRPGDDLTTTFYKSENENQFFFFSKRDSDGEVILTNALVEIAK